MSENTNEPEHRTFHVRDPHADQQGVTVRGTTAYRWRCGSGYVADMDANISVEFASRFGRSDFDLTIEEAQGLHDALAQAVSFVTAETVVPA